VITAATSSDQYQRIARVIEQCIRQRTQQPGLASLAQAAGISEYHLQRLFSQWVGVSPKQFLKFLTKQDALRRLRHSTVLDTALECGLSGSSRLHDLLVTCEGVSPGEYQRQGQGLVIVWGVHATPFGQCLLAQTGRGVCKLAFFDSAEQQAQLLQELQEDWAQARLQEDTAATAATLGRIFPDQAVAPGQPLHLLLQGSPFQLKVWEALLRIPPGQVCSYQQVATAIGAPQSVRAVASAVARNHIGYLIPCHRVIRSSGEFSQYRWGETRKLALIGWEACQQERATTDARAETDSAGY